MCLEELKAPSVQAPKERTPPSKGPTGVLGKPRNFMQEALERYIHSKRSPTPGGRDTAYIAHSLYHRHTTSLSNPLCVSVCLCVCVCVCVCLCVCV